MSEWSATVGCWLHDRDLEETPFIVVKCICCRSDCLACATSSRLGAKRRRKGLSTHGGRAIVADGSLSFGELSGNNLSAYVVCENVARSPVFSNSLTIARTRTCAVISYSFSSAGTLMLLQQPFMLQRTAKTAGIPRA